MSQQRIATIAMIISIAVGLLGCAPRVRVIANPGPLDQGIRYYRPKPYLKVVPLPVQVAKDATRVETGLVSITLEYLPDFSEEYAIDVRSGLGVADVAIKLEDGWNLTEISQDLDSQTDENISAAAELIKAVGEVVPTAQDARRDPIEFQVAATDVPLGYYESVIGCGPDGRKRLYGFRYLGFLPYEMCPTTLGGGQRACCGDPQMPLYGLTFSGGKMVFRSLDSLRTPPVSDETTATTAAGTAPNSSYYGDAAMLPAPVPALPFEIQSPQGRTELAAKLEVELRRTLVNQFPETSSVRVEWFDAGGQPKLRASIAINSILQGEAVRAAANRMVGDLAQGRFLYQVDLE